MIVDRVSATIRVSRDTGDGWRTLELGAEGTILVDAGETIESGINALYAELHTQLYALWGTVQTATPQPVATPPLPPAGPEYAPARPPCPTPGCGGTRGPRSAGGFFDLCWNCSNEARNDAKGFSRERAASP